MREKLFESKLKRYLESQGIYRLGTDISVMPREPIGYYTKRHGNVFTGSGLPDMQIVVNGHCIDVELKNEKGKPSPIQEFVIEQINRSRGTALVVRPQNFDEFKQLIGKFL